MSLTFGLKTPRDLLGKLRRDAYLLDQEVNSDRFFNFVVTGYSLLDWVKKLPTTDAVAKKAVEALYTNQWIAICGDLANSVKHFTLKTRVPIISKTSSSQGWGCGRWGKGGYGIGEEQIYIELNDGQTFSALDIANNVISVWEQFFKSFNV